MRRAASWCLAGGLVIFAAASAFSISVATVGMLVALAGGIALAVQLPNGTLDRILLGAVGVYLALKFITVLTAVEVRPALREFVEYWPFLALIFVPLAHRAGPRREVYLRVLAVCVSLVSIYAVFQHFVGVDYLHHRVLANPHGRYRAVAFFSHHLTWGGYALVAALFFAGLRPIGRGDRVLFAATSALAFLGMLATYARGPEVGFVAGLAVLVVLRRSGWKLAAAAVVITALALAVTPGLFNRFSRDEAVDLNPHAAESRTGIWLTAWAIGRAHPLTGVGPHNFRAAFDRYKIDPALLSVDHAHDQWLDEWATSGILGVIGFNILLGGVGLALWRRRLQADGLALAALAAWTGLACASLFECHFSDAEILLLAVFCAGMGLLPQAGATEVKDRE